MLIVERVATCYNAHIFYTVQQTRNLRQDSKHIMWGYSEGCPKIHSKSTSRESQNVVGRLTFCIEYV